MPAKTRKTTTAKPATHQVDDAVFAQVYDSPASRPGRHKRVAAEADVRATAGQG